MAKRSGDFIIRDRLQLSLDENGDSATLYGRMDLSDFVNAIEKQALAVKEIYLQVRDPNNASGASTNTGIWNPMSGLAVAATPGTASGTSRARPARPGRGNRRGGSREGG